MEWACGSGELRGAGSCVCTLGLEVAGREHPTPLPACALAAGTRVEVGALRGGWGLRALGRGRWSRAWCGAVQAAVPGWERCVRGLLSVGEKYVGLGTGVCVGELALQGHRTVEGVRGPPGLQGAIPAMAWGMLFPDPSSQSKVRSLAVLQRVEAAQTAGPVGLCRAGDARGRCSLPGLLCQLQ